MRLPMSQFPENFMEKLLKNAESLPTLPNVVMQVNAMLQDPDTDTRDLSRMIERDVALVTRILRLVNSAFFGLRSKVGNIPDAVSILGFDTLHRITLSLAVITTLGSLRKSPGDWLWPHAIRTAVGAEYLAIETKLCRPNDAFVAGLLHDIGLMVLARSMPDLFQRILDETKKQQKPFFIVEESLIPGFSHATLGGLMAKRWYLPPCLCQAIALHHRFPDDNTVSDLAILVHGANILDTHAELMGNGELLPSSMHPLAWQKLQASLEKPDKWFPPLWERAGEACKLFLGEPV